MRIEKEILEDLKKLNLHFIINQPDTEYTTLLFDVENTLKFLDFCEDNKIYSYGYDGFRIKGKDLCPDLKFIGTTGNTSISGHVMKKGFLQDINETPERRKEAEEMYFEFVLTYS